MDNTILENWKDPFHRGIPSSYGVSGQSVSPACGDEITIYLIVNGDAIKAAHFEGEGCVICLGMASLLVRWLDGRIIDEAMSLTEMSVFQLASDVEIDSRRVGCALVAYKALKAALASL